MTELIVGGIGFVMGIAGMLAEEKWGSGATWGTMQAGWFRLVILAVFILAVFSAVFT